MENSCNGVLLLVKLQVTTCYFIYIYFPNTIQEHFLLVLSDEKKDYFLYELPVASVVQMSLQLSRATS